MELAIAIISIFGITGLVWLGNHVWPFRVCPICVGVSGTWLWMLIGTATNLLPTSNFQLLTSILMGGTIVGVAYQIEKRLIVTEAPANKSLLWKILFIPTGFAAAYSLVNFWWMPFSAAAVAAAGLAWMFLKYDVRASKNSSIAQKLEKKLKECC